MMSAYNSLAQILQQIPVVKWIKKIISMKNMALMSLSPLTFQHNLFNKIIYFQLEDNCFTILCWFLPYININQPQAYVCPLPLEPPTPLSCHRAPDLSSLRHIVNFYQLSSFTYGNIYAAVPLSQFLPPSPSLSVSTSLLSMSASPLMPCRQVYQSHLSKFPIYVLI